MGGARQHLSSAGRPVRLHPVSSTKAMRLRAVAWGIAVLLPVASPAQDEPVRITLESTLTASDNAPLNPPGSERRGLIATMRPEFALSHRGAGLQVDLTAAAHVLGDSASAQRSGIGPEASALIKATVIDRILYLDASADLRQVEADAFGSRVDPQSDVNRRSSGSYRLSPYVEYELSPHSSLLLRHEANLTTNASGDGSRLASNRSVVRLERDPVPLGSSVELSRLTNEFGQTPGIRFTLDTARIRATLGLAGQVVLSAVIGRDNSRSSTSDYTDTLRGAGLHWRPTPRTDLLANIEQRFFGRSGELSWRHRMPFMLFALNMTRQPVMASTPVGPVLSGPDMRTFLNEILTTGYLDAGLRGSMVDDVVAQRGIDTRLTDAIDIMAGYPQVRSAVDASWVLLGSRNTVTLTFHSQLLRQLRHEGQPLVVFMDARSDSRQSGGSLQLNRRLTPQLNAAILVQWSKINGLAAREGDRSDEWIERVSLTHRLSPRTGVTAGLQRNRFTTTVTDQTSWDATLMFVGFGHRF